MLRSDRRSVRDASCRQDRRCPRPQPLAFLVCSCRKTTRELKAHVDSPIIAERMKLAGRPRGGLFQTLANVRAICTTVARNNRDSTSTKTLRVILRTDALGCCDVGGELCGL